MQTPAQQIDLRKTKCPLNFVQAKLALEKLAPGEILEIWIGAFSESAVNIPQSLQQEGYQVIKTVTEQLSATQKIWVQK